jgi:tetratricopeptide (TPR) repeat protein
MVLSEAEDITGFDLNRWAYFLMRLQLFRAAMPMAKRALLTAGRAEHFPRQVRSMLIKSDHSLNAAACEDTYGWALCYEARYAEAKALLDSALSRLPDHDSDRLEVQYHRAHAAFWSGEQVEAFQIVQEMKTSGPDDLWTRKAEELVGESKHETTKRSGFRYDVVLSFAGEDRASAEDLAHRLAALGLSVFYDDFERASLWGQNLYEYLTDIYRNRGKYCVVLVSKHYASKRWTRLEWRAVQARCFREQGPYCLPVQIDMTELPGLLPTTGYLSISKDGLQAIAGAVADKVKGHT